jgi:hypothetical protein
MTHATSGTLEGAKARAQKCARIPAEHAENYFRAAAWLSLIDIDLTKPIVFSLPLRRDLAGTRKRLARELLGEPA